MVVDVIENELQPDWIMPFAALQGEVYRKVRKGTRLCSRPLEK